MDQFSKQPENQKNPGEPNMSLPSSPIQATISEYFDISTSDGHSDVLEDLHTVQSDRINKLYKPLSSSPSRSPYSRSVHYHHQPNLPRGSVINSRNKHNKLKQVRERYRQDKLNGNREKISDEQTYNDYLNRYENELNELNKNLDLDKLIDEEREISVPNPDDEYINEMIQLEVEEMVKNLDLSDNQ